MGRNSSRVDAMHAKRSITITSTVRHGGLSTSTAKSEAKSDAMHESLLTIEVGFADFGFHADGFGKSRMEAVLVERVQEAGFLCPDACVAWLA